MNHWIPRVYDKYREVAFAIGLFVLIAAIAIAFAWFWQSVGARTERTFLLAEKYEAIQTCRNEGASAFEHLESGTIICSRGSLRAQK